MNWYIRVRFTPKVFWIGFYWTFYQHIEKIEMFELQAYREFRLYITLVPLFPIVITRTGLKPDMSKYFLYDPQGAR